MKQQIKCRLHLLSQFLILLLVTVYILQFGIEAAYHWSTAFAGSNSVTGGQFILQQILSVPQEFDLQYWKRGLVPHNLLYPWCYLMYLPKHLPVPLHIYFLSAKIKTTTKKHILHIMINTYISHSTTLQHLSSLLCKLTA